MPPLSALNPIRETWRGARTLYKSLRTTATHAPVLRAPLHRVPHLPSAPNGNASLSKQLRENLHEVGRAAFGGVFRIVRSGQSGGAFRGVESRLHAHPTTKFQGIAGQTTRARYATAGLGRSTRPTIRPSFANPTLGLQSARTFSSSQPVLGNVINNIPLGLRALGNEVGMDERKWKAVKRDIRRGRIAKMEKGKAAANGFEGDSKAMEFGEYFTVGQDATEKEPSIPSVLLVLPLEPDLPFPSTSSLAPPTTASTYTNYRLLTPTVLHTLSSIQHAYTHHSQLIHALSNRLTSAGVFDDPGVKVELWWREDGNKEVHVTFGGEWRIGDVRQALGVWAGEETWYDLIDLRSSPTRATSEEEHDAIVSTFVLPSLNDATRSLSPVSSVWLDDVASQPSFEYGLDQEELVERNWKMEGEDYDLEVRTFLTEVEEAQRGRLLDFSML